MKTNAISIQPEYHQNYCHVSGPHWAGCAVPAPHQASVHVPSTGSWLHLYVRLYQLLLHVFNTESHLKQVSVKITGRVIRNAWVQLCRNAISNLSAAINNKPQWRIVGVEINLPLSSCKALVGLSAKPCLGQVRAVPLRVPHLCLIHQCLGCSDPVRPATRDRASFIKRPPSTHAPHPRGLPNLLLVSSSVKRIFMI